MAETLIRAAERPAVPAPSDVELVTAFRASRSEAAIAELLRRHGSMVLNTCRRILGDIPEVEDAAQAAFLVLVRRIHAMPEERIAAWLHGVAVRCARRIARDQRRRRRWEGEAGTLAAVHAGHRDDPSMEDARIALDGALARLPAPWYQAVVLTYLEGRTQKEAAMMAGCPVGTMGRRASDGLKRLRTLLRIRRVSSDALMAGLAHEASSTPLSFSAQTVLAAPSGAAVALAGSVAMASTVVGINVMAAASIVAALLALLIRHEWRTHHAQPPASAIAASIPLPTPGMAAAKRADGAELRWRDDFKGTEFDLARWIIHDPSRGQLVSQHDGLRLVGNGESTVFGTTGIESVERLPRAGLTITATVRAAARTHALALGYGVWPQPGLIADSYEVLFANGGLFHFVHAPPGNSSTHGTWVELVDLGSYEPGKPYRLQMRLKPVGADLFIDAGAGFPDQPNASLRLGSFDGTVFLDCEQQTESVEGVEIAVAPR